MRCESCGSTVDESALICGTCGRELSAPPDRPAPRPAAVPPPIEVAAETPRADAPKCPVHPTEAYVLTCKRCGRFACGKCVISEGFDVNLCLQCLETTELAPRQKKHRGRKIAFTLTMSVSIVILIGMLFASAVKFVGTDTLWPVVDVVALIAGALALAGVIVFQLREYWPGAFFAVVYVAAAAVVVMFEVRGACCGILMLAIAGRGGYALWQLKYTADLVAAVTKARANA